MNVSFVSISLLPLGPFPPSFPKPPLTSLSPSHPPQAKMAVIKKEEPTLAHKDAMQKAMDAWKVRPSLLFLPFSRLCSPFFCVQSSVDKYTCSY
jgi:hypothetical protein